MHTRTRTTSSHHVGADLARACRSVTSAALFVVGGRDQRRFVAYVTSGRVDARSG